MRNRTRTRKSSSRLNRRGHIQTRKKRGGLNEEEPYIKKCKHTFCKHFVRKSIKMRLKFLENFKKSPMDKITPEQKKNRETFIKEMESLDPKKVKQEFLEGCLLGYCNPGCKGTIFEDGLDKEDAKKLPMSVIKKFAGQPNNSQAIQFLTKARENIFKDVKGNTVLEKGFFKGLKKVHHLKKKGAVSGCTVFPVQ